jgi:hypothetical protein
MEHSDFTIDCDTCVMQHSNACSDCIVTFICSRQADEAVVIPLAEYAALRAMGDAGLVPRLRHEARAADWS